MLTATEKQELQAKIDAGKVGHWGTFQTGTNTNGVVTCSWCGAHTSTDKTPPLSIVCSGCRRYVRAEPNA